jgi:hypothetical protein
MLCPKGNAGIQALYDSDRLKYPLIRIGERGDGRYKRVTWDEAYEYIKNVLVKILEAEKDNRSTIAYCNGEGLSKEGFEDLVGKKLGSPNYVDEVSICLETAGGGFFLDGQFLVPQADSDELFATAADLVIRFDEANFLDALRFGFRYADRRGDRRVSTTCGPPPAGSS